MDNWIGKQVEEKRQILAEHRFTHFTDIGFADLPEIPAKCQPHVLLRRFPALKDVGQVFL